MTKQQASTKLQTLRTEHTAAVGELEKYKLLVESVQDYAIFMMDPTGHIQTWNKGAQRFKGYKADEIIGMHFSAFYSAADISNGKPERELKEAILYGRTEDENWRYRKDGSRFWASVVITALHDSDGNLVGFAKVTRDLSERKQHEDDLRDANKLLKEQQRELRLLNQSKDEFISLASHQLRTPATAIKQLLGLFVEGFVTDISEQNLALIQKAYDTNDRQINIVNSLLKVAQVDSGKVILRMANCDIRQLIESVVDDFRDAIVARKQSLELALGDDLLVEADAQHLRMALENIVSNASKYTYAHGSIVISAVRHTDTVAIAIRDNGVGIAPKDLGMLFEKFKRIPNDLSDEVGGTGLGLYWANKVMKLHNGWIAVESELNEGTTFTVYLPLVI